MKTTVLRENLRRALGIVERAVAKSPSLPILNNISLSAKKNILELAATDLELGIRFQILAKNEEEGTAVVPARPFSQLIGVLEENQVSLRAKEGGLFLETKDQRALLKTLSSEEFPIIPSLRGTEHSFEVETTPFCQGLNQVVGIAGQTQARPEISGVYFLLQPESLKLAATDSFRLAEKTLLFAGPQTQETSFILPQKTSRELLSILGDLSGKTKIFFSPTQALFENNSQKAAGEPSLQIVSRLIEGEYPQYQDVIPKTHQAKAVVDRQELINHLRAASVFSGKMNDVRFEIDPKKKGIEISARSAEVGEHSSFLAGVLEGERLDIAFNWRFLLEGASHIRAKDIGIAFGGEEAPALLRPSGAEEHYLYVVMPVKA